MKKKLFGWLAAALCLGALVAGCGGGGGSSDGGSPTSVVSGIVVDPYIMGAKFQEIQADGTVVQESTPSNENGAFGFLKGLTKGNRLVMSFKGLHNGVPYTGNLSRKIDVTSGILVVSPLTTLLDKGMTAAEVVSLLNTATGGTFTEADLTADPVARLKDGIVTDADKKFLAAVLAVNAAFEVANGNAEDAGFAAMVAALATKLSSEVLPTLTPANVNAVVSAAVAVADYVADNSASTSPTEYNAAINAIVPTLVTDLISAAGSGQLVSIGGSPGSLVFEFNTTTIKSFLAKGFEAIDSVSIDGKTDDFLVAVNNFSAAAAVAAADTDSTATQSEKDQAHFFGGFAQLALLADPYSDLTSNGLNNSGDLLDGFWPEVDVPAGSRDRFKTIEVENCTQVELWNDGMGNIYYETRCEPKTLRSESPDTAQVQKFMAEKVGSGLKAALDHLEAVSPDFSKEVTDAATSKKTQFDAADVAFLKAIAKGMLGQLYVQQAYDFKIDLDDLQSKVQNKNTLAYRAQEFSAQYPYFGNLTSAASLPSAKSYLEGAITNAQEAVVLMEAETDDQRDDFLKITDSICNYVDDGTGTYNYIYSCVDNSAQAIDDFKQNLADAKLALAGPKTIDTGVLGDPTDNITIDATKFFAGVDLRAKAPASFDKGAKGDLPGLFPDPTFGGILVQSPDNFNADLDQDGSPDIIAGYSNFYEPSLDGKTCYISTLSANAFIYFNDVVNDRVEIYYRENLSGSYIISKNVITFTLDSSASDGTKFIALTLDDPIDNDGNGEAYGTSVFKAENGDTIRTESGYIWVTPGPPFVYGP